MKDDNNSLEFLDIRQKAEKQMAENPKKKNHIFHKVTKKLVHELEVHQIELELQNEELVIAQEETRKARDRYMDLYDFAPSIYLTLSRDGKIEELNLNAAQILQKERSNLIGSNFGFFVSLETRPVFEQFIENAFSSNTKETCDVVIKVQDSPLKFVQVYGIVQENSEQCLLTMLDTTESRQAAREIQESEERHRQIFQFSPDSIIIHDLDMNILDVNNVAIEEFGYSREELIGKKITDFYTEFQMERKEQVLADLKKMKILKVETKCVRKNGTNFIAEATPCIYNLGVKPIIHVVIRNISQRREAEEELNKYREHLEETIKLRTQELEKKNEELEEKYKELANFNKLFVGREFRIKELRDQVKGLKEKLGE
jgi:PAS domain S-box-containing protein